MKKEESYQVVKYGVNNRIVFLSMFIVYYQEFNDKKGFYYRRDLYLNTDDSLAIGEFIESKGGYTQLL